MNATVEEEAEKKQPGWVSNPYRGGVGKGSKPAGQLLRDMRFVYENAKEKDETEGHRKCRESYERNPDKFLERLNKLEVHHQVRNERSREKAALKAGEDEADSIPVSKLDDGESKTRELIVEFLQKAKS